MLLGCGEAAGNACGKDKTCSKWRAVAANHIHSTEQQHMLTLVCIMYSSPIQKCGDQQTCIKMEKLFRILISMHIITSTIATAMWQGWERKCDVGQGSVPSRLFPEACLVGARLVYFGRWSEPVPQNLGQLCRWALLSHLIAEQSCYGHAAAAASSKLW